MQWKSLMTMAESRRGTAFKYSNKLDLFLLISVHFKTMTWYYSAFYTWRLDRYTAKRVFQYFNRARKSRAEFTYYSSAVINCYRDDTDQRLIYWRFKDRETWDLTLRWARWTGGCDWRLWRKKTVQTQKKKEERKKETEIEKKKKLAKRITMKSNDDHVLTYTAWPPTHSENDEVLRQSGRKSRFTMTETDGDSLLLQWGMSRCGGLIASTRHSKVKKKEEAA